eukprot:365394-Chlamydomonas_euryale.AAC.10
MVATCAEQCNSTGRPSRTVATCFILSLVALTGRAAAALPIQLDHRRNKSALVDGNMRVNDAGGPGCHVCAPAFLMRHSVLHAEAAEGCGRLQWERSGAQPLKKQFPGVQWQPQWQQDPFRV